MKRILSMVVAALIGALLIALINLLPISAVFKSILYAVLIGLFVYVVGIIMRINK